MLSPPHIIHGIPAGQHIDTIYNDDSFPLVSGDMLSQPLSALKSPGV